MADNKRLDELSASSSAADTDNILLQVGSAATKLTIALLRAAMLKLSSLPALGETPGAADTFLVSDAGVLKSVTYANLGISGSAPLTTKGDIFGFSTVNARLPVGSNTQILTADSAQALGVKWAAPAAVAGVWDLISDQTISADATIDATWAIGAYTEIEVTLLDIVPATDNTNFLVRVSDDSGVSYEATGYVSSYEVVGQDSVQGLSGSDSLGTTSFVAVLGMGNATSETMSGVLKLFNPGGSAWKQMTLNGALEIASGLHRNLQSSGSWQGGTGTITGIRFLMSSGNLTSGRIIVRAR